MFGSVCCWVVIVMHYDLEIKHKDLHSVLFCNPLLVTKWTAVILNPHPLFFFFFLPDVGRQMKGFRSQVNVIGKESYPH